MNPMAIAIFVTFIGGTLAYAFSRKAGTVSQILSFIGSLIALISAAHVWASDTAFWAPFRNAPAWLEPYVSLDLRIGVFEVVLRATRLGNLAAVGSAFIGTLIALYVFVGLEQHRDRGRLAAFSLWALTGALVVSWADNLFLLLLGWETVTLMLYLMVNAADEGTEAAVKSFGILGIADIGMLVAIAFLLAIGRSRDLTLSTLRVPVTSPGLVIAYLLFLGAALAKAGAIPFHSWLPSVAKGSPASVAAMLPASLDKLLGIYLLARMSLDVFVLVPWLRTLLLVIGGVTILAAVLMAMIQSNLKRLLGFHAVSQAGYMVLGIGTGLPLGIAGGLFHMINNALYKSGLFLMAGSIERYAGSSELDDLGGLGRKLPWTFGCGTVFALAISGIPPFNGFVSKWMIYQGALSLGGLLGAFLFVVALFGSVLTLASFAKVLHSVFWGPDIEHREYHHSAEPFAVRLPMLIIAVFCVLLGVWAADSLGIWIWPSVADLGFRVPITGGAGELSFALGLWTPMTVTILLVIAGLVGCLFYLVGGVRRGREVDTFMAGEPMGTQPSFFSGTHFYLTLQRLPVLGGLLRDGEAGAFDLYRLFALMGSSFVGMLRRFHSGLLNLYVSWALIGLAIVILLLAS
jgi:formate hydrogenlyase subunit 3/multisubunit Na+/H+ antiporter MnhD subunit